MTAKTYGQILRDAMDNEDDFERLSMVDREAFERCARAVILEAFRRVEELGPWTESDEVHLTDEERKHNALGKAFQVLAVELKEAK